MRIHRCWVVLVVLVAVALLALAPAAQADQTAAVTINGYGADPVAYSTSIDSIWGGIGWFNQGRDINFYVQPSGSTWERWDVYLVPPLGWALTPGTWTAGGFDAWPGGASLVVSHYGGTTSNFTCGGGTFTITSIDPSNPYGAVFDVSWTQTNCPVIGTSSGHAVFEAVQPPDRTPPVLSMPGSGGWLWVPAPGPDGAVVDYTATATDDRDPNPIVSCSPASGSRFPLGGTWVNCTATDAAGNVGYGSTYVYVADTQPPVITTPGTVVVEAQGPDGAVATFDVTASDWQPASPTVVCTPASGSLFALGDTQVSCWSHDAALNDAHATFVVSVRDTTPPAITVPDGLVEDATTPLGATIAFNATATDTVDGQVPVSCTPASGDLVPPGDSTVTCTAVDAHGNAATSGFVVHVRSAGEQLKSLLTLVDGYQLGTLGSSLHDKLVTVSRFMTAGKLSQANDNLASFVSAANAQSGKGLTASQATTLASAATNIQHALGF